MRLEVKKHGRDFAETEVMAGAELSDRKGVNLPGAVLPLSALTPKDRSDLAIALDWGADWIALSFVQGPDDVAEARKLVAGRAGVLVKLEKPSAVKRLDEIVDLADAVMVARGDLGVEMPPEDVPPLQKQIIHACRRAGKPVVVATQMLESMINAPVPTRAEASDVATAIYEGADAVMLSAETAAGSYPREAVAMMDRIVPSGAGRSELRRRAAHGNAGGGAYQPRRDQRRGAPGRRHGRRRRHRVLHQFRGDGVARRARAAERTATVALTARIETARRLALVWGLHCVHTSDVHRFSDMIQKATRIAKQEGFAQKGQRIVVTAGIPFGTPGATNVLHIAWVND